MAMTGEDITAMIKEAMPDAQVEMVDLAGDNNHWKAVIISKAFEGLSRCLLYTSPSPRDLSTSRMPSSA